MEPRIDEERFVAVLEHGGWKKETVVQRLIPTVEIPVQGKIRAFREIEDTPPSISVMETKTFYLEKVTKTVVENGVKTYYLKYKTYG